MKAKGDDVFADSASLRRPELEPESSEKFSRSPNSPNRPTIAIKKFKPYAKET